MILTQFFDGSLWMWYYDDKMELRVWHSRVDDDRPSLYSSLKEVRESLGADNEIFYDTGDD